MLSGVMAKSNISTKAFIYFGISNITHIYSILNVELILLFVNQQISLYLL